MTFFIFYDIIYSEFEGEIMNKYRVRVHYMSELVDEPLDVKDEFDIRNISSIDEFEEVLRNHVKEYGNKYNADMAIAFVIENNIKNMLMTEVEPICIYSVGYEENGNPVLERTDVKGFPNKVKQHKYNVKFQEGNI